jgi:hypothetical protein
VPIVYPAPRTGTAQDLFRIVTRAYEIEVARRGDTLPEKPDAQRLWIDPFFRALGIFIAATMEVIPADWAMVFHDKLYAGIAAPFSYAFDPADPAVIGAHALAQSLERATGRPPALLVLASHPPVMGDLAHMNLEMVRWATLALREARGRPCRPRMLVATDSFALDTASIPSEAIYAGFMGTFHFGIDRLSLGRRTMAAAMTPRANWHSMARRLLGALADGEEAALLLGGGVPSTARVLYGAREWVYLALEASPLRSQPAEVARRLIASADCARALAAVDPVPARPSRPWRTLEAWLMIAAAGLIDGQTATSAGAAALEILSVPEERRPALIADLTEATERETPLRRRLFRILAGQVKSAVVIPIAHRLDPRGLKILPAWSWTSSRRGELIERRAGKTGERTVTPDQFAESFVRENFA